MPQIEFCLWPRWIDTGLCWAFLSYRDEPRMKTQVAEVVSQD